MKHVYPQVAAIVRGVAAGQGVQLDPAGRHLGLKLPEQLGIQAGLAITAQQPEV